MSFDDIIICCVCCGTGVEIASAQSYFLLDPVTFLVTGKTEILCLVCDDRRWAEQIA